MLTQWETIIGAKGFPRWDEETLKLRRELIQEETQECLEELTQSIECWIRSDGFVVGMNLTLRGKLLKEIVDAIYVLAGTAVVLGLPLDRALKIVHKNNLTKAPNGKVTRRKDGKILKPKDYYNSLTSEFFYFNISIV
jgi:hypothetical protein